MPEKSEIEYEMARERRYSLVIHPTRAASPAPGAVCTAVNMLLFIGSARLGWERRRCGNNKQMRSLLANRWLIKRGERAKGFGRFKAVFTKE
jgi:hypothetical protein